MAAADYTTLAEVETYAGIDFSLGIGPTDIQIGTMITNASRIVDTYARHTVAYDSVPTYTSYHDVYRGMEMIVLPNRPIVSITSMTTEQRQHGLNREPEQPPQRRISFG